MIAEIIYKIYRIFVDREEMIKELRKIWEFSCDEGEHFVHVFLNAPGVGKTALIDQFGYLIESERKGLHVRFNCDSSFISSKSLNRSLVKSIEDSIDTNLGLIETFITITHSNELLEKTKLKFKRIKNLVNVLLEQKQILLSEVQELLKDLSRIIPLLLSADEIQELQEVSFRDTAIADNQDEKGLHYFARLIKGLLKNRILIVLSGTRYHILSQIGGNIGSPIRQKVKPFHVYNLGIRAISQYVDRIRFLLEENQYPKKNDNIEPLLKNYHRFLLAFCGGHPRTMVIITEVFLKSLPRLLTGAEYLDYALFMEYLLQKTEDYLKNTLFTSLLKDAILSLTSHEGFSLIKEWILTRSSQGFSLGKRPTQPENEVIDTDVKNLVFELMNIGIIVQNGQDNYYLTSYYHLIQFLKVMTSPQESFLLQIMTNKFFTLMCGSHSGFGYTFENIFSAALLIHSISGETKRIFPINTSLRTMKLLRGNINWKEIVIENNIYYQTPSAKAIDAFFLQDNVLLLIQQTTSINPDGSKLKLLKEEMASIEEWSSWEVNGWFISLFPFSEQIQVPKTIKITQGEDLKDILGTDLFDRLTSIKKAL